MVPGENEIYLMLSRNETLDDIVDAITERFIPITSANRVTQWNDLSGVGWGSESVPQTRSTRSLDCPFSHRLLSRSEWCFAGRTISIALNVEILRIFRFRGGRGDIRVRFVTSKKRRDIVDSVLLYFLSHNEFACLCAPYISRGIFRKTSSYLWNFKISENMSKNLTTIYCCHKLHFLL